MPGVVLARRLPGRQTPTRGGPSSAPARPGSRGRDAYAGAAPRRSERGRHLRGPRGAWARRQVRVAHRRPAEDGSSRPVLAARAVRDRSGESVATEGDPGPYPRWRDGRRDRGCGRYPHRPGAPVRGSGARRARVPRPGSAAVDRARPHRVRSRTAAGRDRRRAAHRSRGAGRHAWPGTRASAPTATGRSSCSSPLERRPQLAEWVFDPRRRHVIPADDLARRLCLPQVDWPAGRLGALGAPTATVTPIGSRLGGHHADSRADPRAESRS